jgi:hypothetical protein
MQQVAPIKITNKDERYFINRVDKTNINQLLNEQQDCSDTEDMEIESTQRKEEINNTNNGPTHHEKAGRW